MFALPMKPLNVCRAAFLAAVTLFAAPMLRGDIVVTNDGARLVGRITGIADGKITLDTSYAGIIEIDQSKVESFTTDAPLAVRLESGTIIAGQVQEQPEGALAISNDDGSVAADVADISAAWAPGTRDPAVVAAESALTSQLRKWSYEAGVDISGKSGNSQESAIGLRAQAKLEGPRDRLRFYGTYRRTETENPDTGVSKVTSDEAIGGIDYTNFFTTRWGWFIREEIERDTFEGVDFRSTSAGGITHRLLTRDRLRLEGRAGLSYRYESYTDAGIDAEGLPGMEFGALFYWQFADWAELNSEAIYLPAFEDFGNFRFTQKSTIDIPLAASDLWKLRLGLKNEYVSQPPEEREELDTTYFMSLLLNWE